MANDLPGLRIAEYLNRYGDKIIRLYLHEGNNLKYGNEIIQKSECEKIYKSSKNNCKTTNQNSKSDYKEWKNLYFIILHDFLEKTLKQE